MGRFKEPISCVLPAYNEAQNIESTVSSCCDALERLWEDFEIIIVNDGSSDRTSEITDSFAVSNPRVRAIHHDKNMGYGAALRSGFSAARHTWIFFMDSDGQFDPEDLEKFIPHLSDSDMVVGFRSPRADPWPRRLYGRLFSATVRALFGIAVRDVNCAFKIFSAEILEGVTLTSPGALINAELLAVAHRKGIIPFEVPVRHFPRQHGSQTGASLRVILRAGRELIALFYRLRLGGKA